MLTLYGRVESISVPGADVLIDTLAAYLDEDYTTKQYSTYAEAYSAAVESSAVYIIYEDEDAGVMMKQFVPVVGWVDETMVAVIYEFGGNTQRAFLYGSMG